MYFPFLRGRQFELIALRELVEKKIISKRIFPVIEPVKASSTLLKTLSVFCNASFEVALVHNPQVGDFETSMKATKRNFHLEYSAVFRHDCVFPAHIMNRNSLAELAHFSKAKIEKSNIIVVCNKIDFIETHNSFFHDESPRFDLIPDESQFRRKIGQNKVLLMDRFNKQIRNSDYIDSEDEYFSEDHLYYSQEGYIGFSDYSVIGEEYNESGFAPHAVAIHIVYFNTNNTLMIKHFVSDSNDDYSDTAGKFGEALQKLYEWNKEMQLNTFAINTFMELYENKKYPGLGTVKKLCIMHHVELMDKFLNSKL